MASFDDSIGSSDVFISDASFPPPPPDLLATGSSNSSFMSTLTSASRNEPSSPFPHHHDPFSLTKRFSAVGLKEQDPMWDSTARKTPEPVASCRPRPKRDLHFIEDLITLTGGTGHPSPTPSESPEPFPMIGDGRKESRPHSSADRRHSGEMDCSVDGQKGSTASVRDHGKFNFLKTQRSSSRTKHISIEDKSASSPSSPSSSHHFHDLVHYLRKISHTGHSKEPSTPEENSGPSRSKSVRVHRNSTGRPISPSNPPLETEFRARAHSTGSGYVRPKNRPGTCQAVYTIYDSIVKEGIQHAISSHKLVYICLYLFCLPITYVLPSRLEFLPLDGFVLSR